MGGLAREHFIMREYKYAAFYSRLAVVLTSHQITVLGRPWHSFHILLEICAR